MSRLLKFSIFSILIFSISCTHIRKKINVQNIVIEIGYSYKIDVFNGVYEVNDLMYSEKWLKYHFPISIIEKNKINTEFNRLELLQFFSQPRGNEIQIENKCAIYDPIIYTTLSIQTDVGFQKFKFDNSCNKYGIFNKVGPKIQSYLNFIQSIIDNKKEIKLAPKASVIYL